MHISSYKFNISKRSKASILILFDPISSIILLEEAIQIIMILAINEYVERIEANIIIYKIKEIILRNSIV